MEIVSAAVLAMGSSLPLRTERPRSFPQRCCMQHCPRWRW